MTKLDPRWGRLRVEGTVTESFPNQAIADENDIYHDAEGMWEVDQWFVNGFWDLSQYVANRAVVKEALSTEKHSFEK